jgi:hypothetical protein
MVHCTQCQIPENGIPHGHSTEDFKRYFCLCFINPNILSFLLLHECVAVLFMLEAVRRFALPFLLFKFEFIQFVYVWIRDLE